MNNEPRTNTIPLALTLDEYAAIRFAMAAWCETVKSFPIIPEGQTKAHVRESRRLLFKLNDRIQELGDMYGVPTP